MEAVDDDRQSRTEKPTARRLQKSREKGRVPRSAELPPALAIGGFLLFAKVFGADFLETFRGLLRGSLTQVAQGAGEIAWIDALRATFVTGIGAAAPVVGCIALGSAVGQFAQGGFVWSAHGLSPNFAKLDPIANLRGLFGTRNLVAALRSALKLVVVAWVVHATLEDELPALLALGGHDAGEILAFTCRSAFRILSRFLILALFLALADYLHQRFEHVRGLRMSKQEVRDEQREVEGDPLIKARQRARQTALARRRMMAAVPKADVVVVNPTHCAVALRYEKSKQRAPKVVAKGVDDLAARIRALAEQHRVPIYEDPALAWALYRGVEIDREIPADFYRAVAEVLAHLIRLRSGARSRNSAGVS